MSSFNDNNTSLGEFKRPATPEYKLVEKACVTTTNFNPFTTLSLDLSTITITIVRLTFLRSLCHHTLLILVNYLTTVATFLSQLQII